MFTVYLNDGTRKTFRSFRRVRKFLHLSKNFLSKIAANGITYLLTGETIVNYDSILKGRISAALCGGL